MAGELHKSPGYPSFSKSELQLSTVSTYTAGQQQNFPVHQHDAWELIYYQAGYIQCVVDARAFDTRPGMLLVIPPKTPHFDSALTAYKQIYVHLQCGAVPAWLQVYRDDQERSLAALFTGLRQEWRGCASDRTEMLTLLLRQLDLTLRRKSCEPEPTAAEQLVQSAERLFEERLALSPSVAEVAAEVGVSTSTLRAYFVKLRDYSPKVYLQGLRQRRALELIGSSSLSLEEVAELCGYYSVSHLSRYIKRDTGRTPGSFRYSAPDSPLVANPKLDLKR